MHSLLANFWGAPGGVGGGLLSKFLGAECALDPTLQDRVLCPIPDFIHYTYTQELTEKRYILSVRIHLKYWNILKREIAHTPYGQHSEYWVNQLRKINAPFY